MKHVTISPEQARRLAVNAQLLQAQHSPGDKEQTAHIIDTLGYIQIDTIAVVERAHHHTLWTRQPDYRHEFLHELQVRDRRVFEYWAHAMAYVPMSDYRFYLAKMRNFSRPASRWAQHRLGQCRDIMPAVLDRIRSEGPLSAADFAAPAKMALEFLFWRGELMISERRKFQKVYDLTERVLPGHIDTRIPTPEELGHFIVRRALAAFGVTQEREVRSFLQPDSIRDSDMLMAGRQVIADALLDLVESGEIVPVQIDTIDAVYYARSSAMELPDQPVSPTVSLLSPFDNLIIQRDRVQRLFQFDYVLECYLPEAKRTYGYFVMPVLWGDRLVGRLDPRADRKRKILDVRNLVLELKPNEFDELLPQLADKLKAFARFNKCTAIRFEKVTPKKIRRKLEKLASL